MILISPFSDIIGTSNSIVNRALLIKLISKTHLIQPKSYKAYFNQILLMTFCMPFLIFIVDTTIMLYPPLLEISHSSLINLR